MFNFISRRSLSPHLRAFITTCSSSPIHRLFSLSLSSSSSSSSSNSNSLSNSSNELSFTVSYLINSCGFPPESALSTSKFVNIKTPEKTDSLLALLKNYGFTNTQIVDLVKKYPKILLCDPENTLLPKLNFFSSIGFPNPDLARLVTATPRVLQFSLEYRIIPCYSFIRDLLQSEEKTVIAIKREPLVLICDLQVYGAENIEVLRDVGVPISNIVHYITRRPGFHRLGSPRASTDRFRRIVEEVKEMGFNPSTMNFMLAFDVLESLGKSTWEMKVKLYKEWGWSENDILVAFRKRPLFMFVSVDKITRLMDFLVNKVGLHYSVLVNHPMISSLSLEKKIIPRFLLYQVLLDEGLIKNIQYFTTWLMYSESNFVDSIRKNFKEEAPRLLKLYQAKLDSVK